MLLKAKFELNLFQGVVPPLRFLQTVGAPFEFQCTSPKQPLSCIVQENCYTFITQRSRAPRSITTPRIIFIGPFSSPFHADKYLKCRNRDIIFTLTCPFPLPSQEGQAEDINIHRAPGLYPWPLRLRFYSSGLMLSFHKWAKD